MIAVIFIAGCVPAASTFRQATQQELDLFFYAINTSNVSICYGFDPLAKNLPIDTFDYETERIHLYNDCFYKIALKEKNPEICLEMKEVEPMKEEYSKTNQQLKEKGFNVTSSNELFILYQRKCMEEASR